MPRPLGPPPKPKTYREFLALNLRELVLEKFTTTEDFQQALANEGLDLELNLIYRWFSARRFPEITDLRGIADVLGVATDQLLPPCPRHLKATVRPSKKSKKAT